MQPFLSLGKPFLTATSQFRALRSPIPHLLVTNPLPAGVYSPSTVLDVTLAQIPAMQDRQAARGCVLSGDPTSVPRDATGIIAGDPAAVAVSRGRPPAPMRCRQSQPSDPGPGWPCYFLSPTARRYSFISRIRRDRQMDTTYLERRPQYTKCPKSRSSNQADHRRRRFSTLTVHPGCS